MRWQLIVVAVGMARARADACPPGPSLTIAGEILEQRPIEGLFAGKQYYEPIVRRVPSHPRFYFDTMGRRPLYPVFRRADGNSIPFDAEWTPIEGVVALTLAIDHGSIDVEFMRREYPRLVVGGDGSRTRDAQRMTTQGQDEWEIDSDAALFRIEMPDHVEYRLSQGGMYVDPGALVTAIHADGREEVLGGGDFPYDPRAVPWWALGVVLTALGGVWSSRRSIELPV